MTTNLTFKLTAAAALTFCSLALQAEETVQTSEVTVTAGRVEQQLLEVPMAVTVVTNQEIQESAASFWRTFPASWSITPVLRA